MWQPGVVDGEFVVARLRLGEGLLFVTVVEDKPGTPGREGGREEGREGEREGEGGREREREREGGREGGWEEGVYHIIQSQP